MFYAGYLHTGRTGFDIGPKTKGKMRVMHTELYID